MQYLIVNKPVGITPLQCIEQAKSLGFFRDATVSYAGRLDPMASGLLALVDGKETELRHKLMSHDKAYAVTAIFGVSSDSLDVLGRIARGSYMEMTSKNLDTHLNSLIGIRHYHIPRFSSVPVLGKPSFIRAISEKEKGPNPTKEMKVHAAKLVRLYKVRVEEIIDQLRRAKNILRGNFRFDSSLADWNEVNEKSNQLIAADIIFDVSSGTYIRSLVDYLGKTIGAGGLSYGIKRVKLGPWQLKSESFIQHVG